MKKTILFSILMLFAGVVSVLGTTPNNNYASGEAQEVSSHGKLVNAQEIMKAFEEGQNWVKVIVNLQRPQKIMSRSDWNSPRALEELHDEVLDRQIEVLSILSDNEFTLRHLFQNQAGFSGEITQGGLDKFLNDPRVGSIEPIYVLEEHLAQGVPLINASAYRSTYNGQGVAIAICDSGIDYYHPKLGGGAFPNSKVIGGYDFGDNDSNPYPNGAHGTACGGIAGGDLGSTGDYIGGVAYGAKLYALKAKDSSGNVYSDKVIAAWDWCVSHKNDNLSYPILVISTSLGSGRYFSTCDSSESAFATSANNAVAAGITVLVSSGNEGFCDSICSPACLSNVISVGAVYDAAIGTYSWCVNDGSCATPGGSASCDPDEFSTLQVTAADLVAVYSNTASFLDVLAPADDAYTTDITGLGGYWTGDYYPYFGGTSAACPYAAGAVACLQSAAKEYSGSYLSPSEVKSILTSTGDDITDSKVAITKPRINLGQAIDSIIGGGCQEEYPSTDVPKIIPDPGTTTSTLVITDSGTIVDLNVKLDITHTYDSDLDVFLIGPDATRVELFTDVGSSGNNFSNTVLDDEASVAITSGSAPFAGSYQPEGNLSDFDGKNITGTWTLEITDDTGADSGTLTSWSLIIETPCDDCCPTTITSYPYTESFESDFGDWINAEGDDIDWTRHSGPTTSIDTGPSSAHDGTYYLYTEATGSGYPNKQAILDGPCFDLSSLSNPGLRFWYHMYGATMGTLTVEVSNNNCASWTPVWSLSGDQGDSWYEAVIDLFAYSGSTIKVRFVGVTGSSYTSDMAIDYVTVAEGELDAPVLQSEPNITLGCCNIISWDAVPEANEYYAECANDADFTNIDANSDWITSASYEFCGLTSGQEYWYRVKSGSSAWSQTSQAEFQSDALVDTMATSDGDVVLAVGDVLATDTLGNANSNGTYSQETILNVIECNESALLTEIEMYLGIASSQTLQFVVYETPSESGGYGTFNLIHTNLITSGTGTGWYNSGPITVPLVAGKSYCIGVAWSGSSTFYCDFGAGLENISWGRKVSGKSIGIYPAPNSTSVIAYTGTSWYQNLITSGYSSSGSIVSTEINLPADGNWAAVFFDNTIFSGTALTVDTLDAVDDSNILADVNSGIDISGIAATSIKLRANLSTDDPNTTPALHDWSITYIDPAGIESDWSNVESSLQRGTPGDFEPDCDVDANDLDFFTDHWLYTDCNDVNDWCEGTDLDYSHMVDFNDFAILAEYWQAGK